MGDSFGRRRALRRALRFRAGFREVRMALRLETFHRHRMRWMRLHPRMCGASIHELEIRVVFQPAGFSCHSLFGMAGSQHRDRTFDPPITQRNRATARAKNSFLRGTYSQLWIRADAIQRKVSANFVTLFSGFRSG